MEGGGRWWGRLGRRICLEEPRDRIATEQRGDDPISILFHSTPNPLPMSVSHMSRTQGVGSAGTMCRKPGSRNSRKWERHKKNVVMFRQANKGR